MMTKCKRTIDYLGYRMTRHQALELEKQLEDDILSRYNSEEYWDIDIIEEFAHNHRLRRVDNA